MKEKMRKRRWRWRGEVERVEEVREDHQMEKIKPRLGGGEATEAVR